MAFALNRGIRRFKTPLDLVFAAGLANAFPFLSRIKLGPLLKQAHKRVFPNSQPGPMMIRLENIVDQYGASYFLAARWTGVLSTSLIYAGLLYGVNVDDIVSFIGASPSTGAVLGTWAAAVVGTAALFPITSYVGGAIVAPKIYQMTKKMA